jgi:hypothetical protein
MMTTQRSELLMFYTLTVRGGLAGTIRFDHIDAH